METEASPPKRRTRRTFLASLIASLGYVGYRVAVHNHWIIVTRGRRAFDVGIEPIRQSDRDQLSLLVAGDTGKNTDSRARVVAAMREHARKSRPDAGILLGDNFYEDGVDSADDPRFDADFESLFDRKSFDFPFYAVLGNHDCYGNANAQIEYSARSDRWTMPDRYYKISRRVGSWSVDLFMVDTNSIFAGEDVGQQLGWLRNQLSASEANYKIVVGHHPVITGGHHDISPRVADSLAPIFKQCNVDLYLSGHDHDLQMLDSGNGWMQVVAGSGSKLRSTAWVDETIFADATPGYCWLLVDQSGLFVSFYDANGPEPSGRHVFTHSLATQNRTKQAAVFDLTTKDLAATAAFVEPSE